MRLICNQETGGSIPSRSTKFLAVTYAAYDVESYVGNIRKARVAINYDNDGYGLANILYGLVVQFGRATDRQNPWCRFNSYPNPPVLSSNELWGIGANGNICALQA